MWKKISYSWTKQAELLNARNNIMDLYKTFQNAGVSVGGPEHPYGLLNRAICDKETIEGIPHSCDPPCTQERIRAGQ